MGIENSPKRAKKVFIAGSFRSKVWNQYWLHSSHVVEPVFLFYLFFFFLCTLSVFCGYISAGMKGPQIWTRGCPGIYKRKGLQLEEIFSTLSTFINIY